MKQHTSRALILPALIIGALALRLAGLGWGLPFVYHPDEPTHVNIVLNILKTGDYNPHWFKYPSFRVYISLPVAIIYFLLGVSRGNFGSVQDLVAANMVTCGSGSTDIQGLYYGLRLLMTLFGVLGVGYIYLWAQRHWNERVALAAALFVAISPVHVLVSHWYRPDTILMLFSGAAVLASLQLYRKDDMRMYVLCGVLAGLAASVKYNVTALQFIPIILAHLLAKRRLLDWRLLLTMGVALGVFVIITPFALLDLPAFLDGFAFEINHYYVRGHAGADAAVGFWNNAIWYVGKLFHYDGPVVLLAACAPLLVERRYRTEALILLTWPLLVEALNSSASVHTVLALVPVYLVLYLLAAISVDRLVCLLGERLGTTYRKRLLVAVLGVSIIALPLLRSARTVSNFVRPDVRTVAWEWIQEHVSPDTRIALESYGPVVRWEGARYSPLLIERSPEWYQAAGIEYLVASHNWTFFTSPELYPDQMAAYGRLFEFPLATSIEGPFQYLYDPVREIRIHRVTIPQRYELLMFSVGCPLVAEWLLGS